MRKKQQILILFDGPHIAYSPAVAQLHKALSANFNLTVFTQNPGDFSKNTTLPFAVEVFNYKNGISKIFYRISFKLVSLFNKEAKRIGKNIGGKNVYVDYFFRFLKIREYIASGKFDKIICVDLKNLFFVNVMLKTNSYFLSLELCTHEKLLPLLNLNLIDCVIIQSQIRYTYLFKTAVIKTFIIQNAPTYINGLIKEKRAGLIYNGTAWDAFGFGYCLNFLNACPAETLFVLGAIKKESIGNINLLQKLTRDKQLTVAAAYIPDEEVVACISDYEIGFAFYNFDFSQIDNYNYRTAPAGKIFKYMAAGVPVICNNIPGFDFVDEFGCGIRLDQFDAATIQSAVEKIRANYDQYVSGAIRAAKHFSFDTAVKPFIDFIEKDPI